MFKEFDKVLYVGRSARFTKGHVYKVILDDDGDVFLYNDSNVKDYTIYNCPGDFILAEDAKSQNNIVTSQTFLERAVAVQNERAKEYEQEGGERSVEQIVGAFNAITRHKLSEEDGWLFLVLLKAVRAWNTDEYHDDSALDFVSYASLVAEALYRNKKGEKNED